MPFSLHSSITLSIKNDLNHIREDLYDTDMDQGHIYPLLCMPGRGMKSPSLKGGMLNIQNRLYPRNILKKSHPSFYKDFNLCFKKGTVAREITADGLKNDVLSPKALVFSQLPAIMVVFQQYNL